MAKKNEKKTVPVFVPRESKDDPDLFVSINGKRYLIKKGESVFVPTEVAEVIENSRKAKTFADQYIESVANG
ncbi:MAG: hypothetical protein E7523_08325 [Ruminococcaceae bacterium]|nr:hypothetical protein [Oscillospiraceae bacterium]